MDGQHPNLYAIQGSTVYKRTYTEVLAIKSIYPELASGEKNKEYGCHWNKAVRVVYKY